jgi:hypothetical protein
VPFEADKLPQGIRPSGAERVVKRWESDDFIHWRDGRIVFRASGDEVGSRQYYSMPSFRFGNGYLGLLSLLNNDPVDDTVDLELAWSPDTLHWRRICPGQSFISRSPTSELDAGCIYAGWSPIDVNDDETWIYYAGSVGKHGSGLQRRTSLLLSVIPRHRFAGLAADDGKGELLTVPIAILDRELFINVAPVGAGASFAKESEVSVELQRPDGTALPGYELLSCVPVRGDTIRGRVAWRARCTMPSGGDLNVRLKIGVRKATIYTATWG